MKIYFISLIFLFTLIGCSPTTITVKENNHKAKYSLKKGDIVEVILNANPSTGYKWQIVKIDSLKITILNETYIAKTANRDIVGSKGEKIYLFKAISKGNTSINIIYSRRFEKDLTPGRKFNINLEIR